MTDPITHSPLGKKTTYASQYQPDLLFQIPRQINRQEIGISQTLPFKGNDVWNAYELSWLNPKGKPMVAVGEFIIPCESPNLVESKSIKLYLNSFTNTKFDSIEQVRQIIQKDLSEASHADVKVTLIATDQFPEMMIKKFSGINLDHLDVTCDQYAIHPAYLSTEEKIVSEILYSDLLKSNCLITGQPDWASIQIHYSGKKINHAGLLKYLISFRNHNEFHEPCVERIFMDIMRHCQPQSLSIEARYTRRGGLDINPYRSTDSHFSPNNIRLCRQ